MEFVQEPMNRRRKHNRYQGHERHAAVHRIKRREPFARACVQFGEMIAEHTTTPPASTRSVRNPEIVSTSSADTSTEGV